MAKKIILSSKADSDRFQILDYWEKRNKSVTYSRKLNIEFNKTFENIASYPNLGLLTNILNIRIKVIKDYIIIYENRDNCISILRIWDTRQNPEKLNLI